MQRTGNNLENKSFNVNMPVKTSFLRRDYCKMVLPSVLFYINVVVLQQRAVIKSVKSRLWLVFVYCGLSRIFKAREVLPAVAAPLSTSRHQPIILLPLSDFQPDAFLAAGGPNAMSQFMPRPAGTHLHLSKCRILFCQSIHL